jgi:hypothetical protein
VEQPKKSPVGVNTMIDLKKYNYYARKYRHTWYLKHTPLDGIIVGRSFYIL